VPNLLTPLPFLDASEQPANGFIFTQATRAFSTATGFITTVRSMGRIVNGVFLTADDSKTDPFVLVAATVDAPLSITIKLDSYDASGRLAKGSGSVPGRTVTVPDTGTVTWMDLVDVVAVADAVPYVIQPWMQDAMDNAAAAATSATTATTKAGEAAASAASIVRGGANGVAPLDGSSKVPDANLPTRLGVSELSTTFAAGDGGGALKFSGTLARGAAGSTPGSRAFLFSGQEPSIVRHGGKFHMFYGLPGSGVIHRECLEANDPTVTANWSAASATVLSGLSHQSLYIEGENLYLYAVDVATENIKVATGTTANWTAFTVQPTAAMTAPIGNQPSSATGNTYLVKRGEGDYVMFVEANWSGIVNGVSVGMWQTWAATGTSPAGPFTKTSVDPLVSLRPLGRGMAGGPSVYREGDQWVMIFHGTGSEGAVIPTEMYRAVNTGDLHADTWTVLGSGRPFMRRAHEREVDQVADGAACDGLDGAMYLFYSGNQNPNTATAGTFNIMSTRLRPAVTRSASGRSESVPSDAQQAIHTKPNLSYVDVPALNPTGSACLGAWGVVAEPSALGGVVRRNYAAMPADYLAFQLRLTAGSYRFRVLTEHAPDMGILAFRVRLGTLRDVATFSATADLYGATRTLNNAHEFSFTIPGDFEGPVWLQMQSASTKNGASTGFRLGDQGWQLLRLDNIDPGYNPTARPGIRTPAGDDFNRADTTDVPGPKWSPLNSSGDPSTTFRIASNKLSMDTGSATTELCVFTEAIGADCRMEATFTRGTATSVGFVFRFMDYQNYVGMRVNDSGQALMYRVLAGVTTSVLSANGAVLAWPAKLAVTVSGDTCKVYVNGTSVIDGAMGATGALATAQGVGIRGNAVGATPFTVDDFVAVTV